MSLEELYISPAALRLDFRLILSAFRREIVLCMLVPTLNGDLVACLPLSAVLAFFVMAVWNVDGAVVFPFAERREFPPLLVLVGSSISSALGLSRTIALTCLRDFISLEGINQ